MVKFMLKLILLALGAAWLAGLTGVAAQEQAVPADNPAADKVKVADKAGNADNRELTPEEIIRKFTEKESEFYKAWMNYSYISTAQVRILSVNGAPSREWMTRVSEVVFNDDGSREVKTISHKGRIRAVRWTRKDEDVIDNLNPFALTTAELPLYNLKYEGKEKVDELNCYVFAVSPKKIRSGRIYFDGKIWVDDVDLQVVRTLGKAVPQSREEQFPEFETLRQLIDGKYWFPVWTHADERLQFTDQIVRIEQTVTYDDYKKFDAKTRVRYGTLDPDADEPQ